MQVSAAGAQSSAAAAATCGPIPSRTPTMIHHTVRGTPVVSVAGCQCHGRCEPVPEQQQSTLPRTPPHIHPSTHNLPTHRPRVDVGRLPPRESAVLISLLLSGCYEEYPLFAP